MVSGAYKQKKEDHMAQDGKQTSITTKRPTVNGQDCEGDKSGGKCEK